MKHDRQDFQFPFIPLLGANPGVFTALEKQYTCERAFRWRYRFTKVAAFALEPFRWMERQLTRSRINRFELSHPPVFIIGHWRSGTTLLHNLLSANPQFGYCTTYHSLLPGLNLVNRAWLSPLMKWMMPTHRPADGVALHLEYPQEEEFALGNLMPWCFYYAWYFPQQIDTVIEAHTAILSGEARMLWKEMYLRFVKASLLDTAGKVFLSKNPPHTLRIDLLTELFPDARFIFLCRNPYEVHESSLRFAEGVLPTTQLQAYTPECLRTRLLYLMARFFERYEQTRTLIKPGHLLEIRYEDLVRDPNGVVQHIHHELQLPAPRHPKQTHAAQTTDKVKPFSYTFTAETIHGINAIWQPLFTRMGYSPVVS